MLTYKWWVIRYVVVPLAAVGDVIQLGWYFGKLSLWIFSLLDCISWGRVNGEILHLADMLVVGGWQPEYVIGVGRTATIIAALVTKYVHRLPPDVSFETIIIKHNFAAIIKKPLITDSSFLKRISSRA